jgi:hypothetical protein
MLSADLIHFINFPYSSVDLINIAIINVKHMGMKI